MTLWNNVAIGDVDKFRKKYDTNVAINSVMSFDEALAMVQDAPAADPDPDLDY